MFMRSCTAYKKEFTETAFSALKALKDNARNFFLIRLIFRVNGNGGWAIKGGVDVEGDRAAADLAVFYVFLAFI